MLENFPGVRGVEAVRFTSDSRRRVRRAAAAVLCAVVTLGGLGNALGCRRSTAPAPEGQPAIPGGEPATEASAEASAEAAPSPAPSVDPLTQLRWQALAKGEENPGSSASSEVAPAPNSAGAENDRGMNSEQASLRNHWRERVDEARGPFENARAARLQECPELPPSEKRAPEDQSYCDDLERAERLAKDRYEAAKQGAARAGFPIQ